MKYRSPFSMNSMFSGLMSSFIMVISIILVFYLISYNLSIVNMEREIIKSTDEKFVHIIDKYEQSFLQLKNTMLKIYSDDALSNLFNRQILSLWDQKQFVDKLSVYSSINIYSKNYLDLIFIITEGQNGSIVTSEGTYDTQRFFEVIYHNSGYSLDFWLKEMKKEFSFKVFSEGNFESLAYSGKAATSSLLMPVAFKSRSDASFIMIALVNTKVLSQSIDRYFTDGILIFNNYNKLIYPFMENPDINPDITNLSFENSSVSKKTKDGYLFIMKSNDNDLVYYKLVPDNFIKKELKRTHFYFKLIIFVSILVSFLTSLYIVKKFNNPVKHISEILKKSQTTFEPAGSLTNLETIKNNIQKIVLQNTDYIKEINSKDSMLQSFFFYSKMKDVYLGIENIKGLITNKYNYLLILIKLHYTPAFFKNEGSTSGKATYFLKDLFSLYISEHFNNPVVIQIESDQILVIANTNHTYENIKTFIQNILLKMNSEKEFVFFTTVVSSIHNDTSVLNNAYKKVLDIIKYRKPVKESQILWEDDLDIYNNRFYFDMEHSKQFANSLLNGLQEECLELVNNTLDYNFKAEVNSFNFNMLCTEILRLFLKYPYLTGS